MTDTTHQTWCQDHAYGDDPDFCVSECVDLGANGEDGCVYMTQDLATWDPQIVLNYRSLIDEMTLQQAAELATAIENYGPQIVAALRRFVGSEAAGRALDREGVRHPAWCTHDEVDLNGHPDDQYIEHLGDPVKIKTVRGTEVTVRIRWTEFMHNDEVTRPYVAFDGDDGSGIMGMAEFEAGDVITAGAVLTNLGEQIQKAGWWKTAREPVPA